MCIIVLSQGVQYYCTVINTKNLVTVLAEFHEMKLVSHLMKFFSYLLIITMLINKITDVAFYLMLVKLSLKLM